MSNGVRHLGLASPADPSKVTGALPFHGDAKSPNPLVERQRSFAGVLARAGSHPGANLQTDEEKAREGAEQFVAMTFIQPLLKQLRETNQSVAPFAPSAGEKQMQSMLDGVLAEKLVSSERWPLVDRIAQDMLKKNAAKPAPNAGSPGATTAAEVKVVD